MFSCLNHVNSFIVSSSNSRFIKPMTVLLFAISKGFLHHNSNYQIFILHILQYVCMEIFDFVMFYKAFHINLT